MAIIFNGKKCESIKFTFNREHNTFQIINKLNKVALPLIADKDEDILKFVILELINNSLRASQKIYTLNPITMDIRFCKEKIEVIVKDGAGGFDISNLPYDIMKKIDKINVLSDNFLAYREEHNFERFGMGLYLAKTWADEFLIGFINERGENAVYNGPGSVYGTKIYIKKVIYDTEVE